MLFALSHYKCKSYGVVAPGPLRRSWIWNSVSVSDREVSVVSQPSLSLTHTCTCAHAHIYFVCLFQALSHLCWTQPSHRSKSKAILPSVKMFSILPYGFIFMLLTSAHWSVSKCSPVKSCISGKGSTSWGRCWVVSNLLTVPTPPIPPLPGGIFPAGDDALMPFLKAPETIALCLGKLLAGFEVMNKVTAIFPVGQWGWTGKWRADVFQKRRKMCLKD